MLDPANPSPPAREPERRIADVLREHAKKRPEGGRAKWIVWAVFAVPVIVIGILQVLGITKHPVAEQLREKKEREAREHSAPAPGESQPGK